MAQCEENRIEESGTAHKFRGRPSLYRHRGGFKRGLRRIFTYLAVTVPIEGRFRRAVSLSSKPYVKALSNADKYRAALVRVDDRLRITRKVSEGDECGRQLQRWSEP